MAREIAAVPGIRTAGVAFQNALLDLAERNGWDASAIAAVIAAESGFNPRAGGGVWTPKRTASGLIQFVEGTARLLGVAPSSTPPNVTAGEAAPAGSEWRTWTILQLDALEQLPLVEQYFKRAFGAKVPSRPVDYYLATWGAAPGLGLSTVLAREGQIEYTANKGLDADKDGTITVQDLEKRIASNLPAERLAVERVASDPLVDSGGGGGGGVLVALGVLGGVLAWKRVRS